MLASRRPSPHRGWLRRPRNRRLPPPRPLRHPGRPRESRCVRPLQRRRFPRPTAPGAGEPLPVRSRSPGPRFDQIVLVVRCRPHPAAVREDHLHWAPCARRETVSYLGELGRLRRLHHVSAPGRLHARHPCHAVHPRREHRRAGRGTGGSRCHDHRPDRQRPAGQVSHGLLHDGLVLALHAPASATAGPARLPAAHLHPGRPGHRQR